MVLGVGIDWAEEFHLVALGRPGEGVVGVRRVQHPPAAVEGLLGEIAPVEPDPAEVRVVLETRHGLLVERLTDAGFTILPVNPDLVARRRGPAKKKAAARAAGEIGDHPQQFGSPNALACHAGKAPLTPRSGKSEPVVACRLACNHHLATTVQQWASCSLQESAWARTSYNTQRARGKTHQATLRALGNRCLQILWHCLRKGVRHDEATHVANRNRTLGKAA